MKDALALFDVIHTLDRPKLADAIADRRGDGACARPASSRSTRAREAQKGGIPPLETDAFVADCRGRIDVVGPDVHPARRRSARPHFALLKKFARRNGLPGLSMGMSGDYETAVRMGATHVRIGSAIFGRGPRRNNHRSGWIAASLRSSQRR